MVKDSLYATYVRALFRQHRLAAAVFVLSREAFAYLSSDTDPLASRRTRKQAFAMTNNNVINKNGTVNKQIDLTGSALGSRRRPRERYREPGGKQG